MSSESWPPQLKDWVAKCLGQMTDANRTEAQAELRQVIAEHFAARTLWTTDWTAIQLKSLQPKPLPNLANLTLKRKSDAAPPSTKKAKKAALKSSYATTPDFNDTEALNRRAMRFSREHNLEKQKSSNGIHSSIQANSHHSHLFNNSRSSSPFANSDDPEVDPNVPNWDKYTIVGTSQELFKDYLRLTSEPKPETIRPYPILQQTLLALKKKWKDRVSYQWICNQFKSLRQDLTVQRIKNQFTVEVYEIHARMALESNDMVEYNACQATLKTLYELGIPGKVEEFTAYRILMLLHGLNRTELNLYVGQLTPQQKADKAVHHALEVQRAIAMGNYHSLFLLYETAENMGAYIMDHFIDRERVKALMVMTKAYRTLTLKFVSEELAFESIDEARGFVVKYASMCFSNPNSPDADKIIDCKVAHPRFCQSFESSFRRVGIKGAV